MKLATRVGIAGGLALLLVYGAGQVAVPHTSNQMPKPKHMSPNADGRVFATVQLCWRPQAAVAATHYVLGPLDRGELGVAGEKATCVKPYTRNGLVSPGDRVVISYVMDATTRATVVKWRITINNVMRMEGAETAQSKLNACIVGTPPC